MKRMLLALLLLCPATAQARLGKIGDGAQTEQVQISEYAESERQEKWMILVGVIAAADEAMRARGYSVQATSATEESGVIEARPPRTTDWPKVELRATAVADTAVVEISVSPWGDQELSRSLLDGVLRRLGL